MNRNVTIVTGLWDLGRGSIEGWSKRDFSTYKEKFLEKQKDYYEKNKEQVLLRKDERKESRKKYYQNNREKILEKRRENYHNKKQS
jgi:uncharacterized protein YbaP (TraB family)